MPGRVSPFTNAETVTTSDEESSGSSDEAGSQRNSGAPTSKSSQPQKRKSTTALASAEKRSKGNARAHGKVKTSVPVGSESDSDDSEKAAGSGIGSRERSKSNDEDDDDDEVSSDKDDTCKPPREPTKKINGTSTPASAAPSPPPQPAAPPKRYAPPPGFERASSHINPKIEQLFSASNLKGKQIWHITAPMSLPIDSITSFDLGVVKSGKTVLEHEGVEYAFASEAKALSKPDKLLVLGEQGKFYRAAPSKFTEILHLQRVVKLQAHPGAKGSEGAGSVTVPAVKEVRQQPEGLRRRHWPTGFEQNELDVDEGSEFRDIDEEEARDNERRKIDGAPGAAAKESESSVSLDSSVEESSENEL